MIEAPRIHLAHLPTPFQPLDRISEQLGGPRIWVKRDDFTGSTLSGNKVRKLEFSIAQALAEGCNHIITCGGVQSNHCRATAFAGAQLGLSVHLMLRGQPESVADGNLLLDYLAGASLSFHQETEFNRNQQKILEYWQSFYEKEKKRSYFIPVGASDEVGMWGYIQAVEELIADFHLHNINPDYLFCATGSGGTQAGLAVGCHLANLDCSIIGMAVCDSERYFVEKMATDIQKWSARYHSSLDASAVSLLVNDKYKGPAYAVAEKEVFDTIQQLAQLEGLVLDPVYTGKAFHGIISEIKNGNLTEAKDIVFIHTGGTFGLFPQKQKLIEAIEKQEN